MKVLVDAESERILGASLLCIEGDEIVHSLLDVDGRRRARTR